MGQNRHGVGRCAKLGSAIGNAGDGTSLYRQRHAVGDAFFRSHIGDFFRSSGTQVNDGVLRQFHCRAAGDDLLRIHGNRRNRIHRNAEFTSQSAVIGHTQTLHVIFF